jgi:hypothetical protein
MPARAARCVVARGFDVERGWQARTEVEQQLCHCLINPEEFSRSRNTVDSTREPELHRPDALRLRPSYSRWQLPVASVFLPDDRLHAKGRPAHVADPVMQHRLGWGVS